jgi:hypothetical protein
MASSLCFARRNRSSASRASGENRKVLVPLGCVMIPSNSNPRASRWPAVGTERVRISRSGDDSIEASFLGGKSELASTAHGLSPAVRAALNVRALQSLTIALDCAVQAGRSGGALTTNLFIEALAERWSGIYRQTRDTWGTGRLRDFKPSTVRNVREELVGQGVAYYKLWEAIRGGVPGLY